MIKLSKNNVSIILTEYSSILGNKPFLKNIAEYCQNFQSERGTLCRS